MHKISLIIFFLITSAMFVSCISDNSKPAEHSNLTLLTDSFDVLNPGLISTALYERDFAMHPEKNLIIYSAGTYNQKKRCLVGMTIHNEQLDQPSILPFSGVHQDIEPFFSPDGQYLYFASNRPLDPTDQSDDYNIWKVSVVDGKWGTPQPLDTTINTDGNEFYPAIGLSGNLYFTAHYPPASEDIYMSRYHQGRYSPPIALDSQINTRTYEFNAYISPEEDLVIYSSYGRHDGMGGGDLYMNYKLKDGRWSESIHLGPEINSTALDYCPYYDKINRQLYFTSNREYSISDTIKTLIELSELQTQVMNGAGNIFRVPFDPEKHKY